MYRYGSIALAVSTEQIAGTSAKGREAARHALAGLRIRGGITNLSDEDPIVYPSQQQANTDPASYDVLGRRWFVNLTYTF